MDQKQLGIKLKKLRENSGLIQEDVENIIGLPNKALTHIENGSRKVSTFELAKLAEIFHVPISDFFAEEDKEEDLWLSLHRIAPGLETDPKVKVHVAKCIQILREGFALKELLGLSHQKPIRTYSNLLPKDIKDAKNQGEEVAEKERRSLEVGESPIYDIVDVLSSQGIWTAQSVLPYEMSGIFLHHVSLGMAIIVNAKHSSVRQRFSYAHEYAHALFDSNRTVSISKSEAASDLSEVRANCFASAFLMPLQGIFNLMSSLGKGEGGRIDLAIFDGEKATFVDYRQTASFQKINFQTVATMAHHFRVSYQTAVFRLHNLGCFKANYRDFLLNEESKGKEYLRILNLEKKSSDQNIENLELKAQIANHAIEAFQRELISRGRLLDLCKILDLSGKELLQLAESGKDI